MGVLKPWHIIVLVVVLILLFGAKRLPDAARSLGRSLRIIKAETKGLVDDDKDNLADKADANHGYSPLQGEVQQPYQQPGYQQAPPPGYQQPQPGFQQAPPPGYQQPAAPQSQPFVDPVQHRTNDR
ncbi:Sec-independent protein translocase subunit TatA [Actinoplanes derwentensis]|uniref:Sec-independent protein translocase protein TatA n=1 Tax=Actinoplanes derwentensis TaxID=113562 RepID=A0A1H1Q6M5_9ACTN|nr:Sec-independent protein translocase subunit TatA [Actinoplanes derwentensis]SDS19050.1 sec-independent protein translocase protein TatA [Actinoplanes derwentensis]